MSPLPVVSGEEAIAALEHLGYRRDRQKGSHVRMKAEGRSPITVPLHRELKAGTLRSIIRTAGVSVEEFTAALDR